MSIFGAPQPAAGTSGGGLFGATNTQQQQQPAGGGLFGAQNTAQQQQPSLFGSTTQQPGGLFGSTTTQPPQQAGGGPFGAATTTQPAGNTGGGLFGSAPAAQPAGTVALFGAGTQQKPAGGLFGAPAVPAAQAKPSGLFGSTTTQPAAATGGFFGSTQPATGAGTNLFGSTQPTAGAGIFGSTQPAVGAGTNLFGSTQPAAGAGTNLFGSTQPAAPTATGGGLFGSTTQPAATGGLFGSTTQPQQQPGLFGSTTQQPAAAGGLFGSTTNQQPQQQQTGGLFGSAATQPQQNGGLFGAKPGGLFGSTTTPATTSLFGQAPQQTQQPAATGGLFSQPSQQGKPLFGAPAQTGLFGGGTSTLGSSTLGTSALGAPAPGAFGASALGATRGPSQQQTDPQTQHAMLLQKIEGIYNAWNPQSPQCRFKHTFYNYVGPNQVNLYRKPPNVTDDLWEKAVRENPDPKRLVPVVALGFDDLRERVNGQTAQAEQHQTHLKDLQTRLSALRDQHNLNNTPRLQRASVQQRQITQRLCTLIQHLHLLIPAVRSSAIRPEEEALRGHLEEIEEEIRRGRLKGKLNELWALIGAVSAAAEREKGKTSGVGGSEGGGGWTVVDEDGLAHIAQILGEQQNGLSHLTKVLQKDLKDLDVITGSRKGNGVLGEDV